MIIMQQFRTIKLGCINRNYMLRSSELKQFIKNCEQDGIFGCEPKQFQSKPWVDGIKEANDGNPRDKVKHDITITATKLSMKPRHWPTSKQS